jgi:hypothetical protein
MMSRWGQVADLAALEPCAKLELAPWSCRLVQSSRASLNDSYTRFSRVVV